MNNIDQIPLASLRPDKFDDVAVKDQILLIQRACEDADPDVIALVFHECDYNMQKTIARIKAGDFQDGEWQTAKSTNKKKISNHQHPSTDQIGNGNALSDSERSGSQRTSPTSSLRGGYRRNDRFGYSASTRTDTRRRGTDPGRNQFNSRYPMPKSVALNPSETSFPVPQSSTEDIPQMTSSLVDQYDHQTQSLTFDNSQKTVPSQSSSKRPLQSSAIIRMPVFMHPAVQFSLQSIDIQFGDILWQDSMPVVVAPSNEISNGSNNNNNNNEEEEEELSSMVNTENQDIHETLSSNYLTTHHQPTNESDNHLLETTGSLSITNAPIVSPENTSHLSDHLTNSNQYSSQSQEPVQIPINRLPPTSTPRPSEYPSPTSQPIPNTTHHNHHHHHQQQQQQQQQQNHTNVTPSAFTPVNRSNNYQAILQEYSQTGNWNTQSSNHKVSSKTSMIPTGHYSQTSYPIPSQQQPIFFQTYPYSSVSPTVLQVFAPIEHWPSTGFPTPLESYPYAHTNYLPTYTNPRHYHAPNKYNQPSFDKEFFAHYGQQTRPSNTDVSYQQQTSTSSQSTQDTPITTSKLSPTAAAFSQGAPLTSSPSNTTFYVSPMPLSMPNYHPDRAYSYSHPPPLDNRDHRNGANNRTNYYHYGQ